MMDTAGFVRDSPLGLGWAMGHVTLRDAVEALAQSTGRPVAVVLQWYNITPDW